MPDRFDRATIHAMDIHCAVTPKPPIGDFVGELRLRGVDTQRHRALVHRAHDDMIDGSRRHVRDALLHVMHSAAAPYLTNGPFRDYERRVNGIDDTAGDDPDTNRTMMG